MRFRQLQAALVLAPTAADKAKEAQTMSTVLNKVSEGWSNYEPTIDPGFERETLPTNSIPNGPIMSP